MISEPKRQGSRRVRVIRGGFVNIELLTFMIFEMGILSSNSEFRIIKVFPSSHTLSTRSNTKIFIMKNPKMAMPMGINKTNSENSLSSNMETSAPTDQRARKPNQKIGKARLYQNVHFDEIRIIYF